MPVTTLRRLSVGCAFLGSLIGSPSTRGGGGKSTPPGPLGALLLTEKRNRLVIRRRRDRLQIGVDVDHLLIGQHLLGVWRHVAARCADEPRERWIGEGNRR